MKEKKKYSKIGDAINDGNFIEATQMITDILDNKSTNRASLERKTTMSSVTKEPITLNAFEALLYNDPKRFIEEDGSLKKNADTFIYAVISLAEVNPNERYNHNENILLRFASAGSPELFEVLLNNGTVKVDIKETDSSGHNALTYAVWNNNIKMIEYLVKDKGFDINEENFFSDMRTPLHWACIQLENASIESFDKYKETIEKLIELGADLTKKDSTEDMSMPVELIPSYEEDEMVDEEATKFAVLCDNLFEELRLKTKEKVDKQESDIEAKVGLPLSF